MIQKSKNLKKLVRFLVYEMNSLDGNKNSSQRMYEALLKKKIRGSISSNFPKLIFRRLEEDSVEDKRTIKKIKHTIMRKVETRYSIFWLRQKISFMAFLK